MQLYFGGFFFQLGSTTIKLWEAYLTFQKCFSEYIFDLPFLQSALKIRMYPRDQHFVTKKIQMIKYDLYDMMPIKKPICIANVYSFTPSDALT